MGKGLLREVYDIFVRVLAVVGGEPCYLWVLTEHPFKRRKRHVERRELLLQLRVKRRHISNRFRKPRVHEVAVQHLLSLTPSIRNPTAEQCKAQHRRRKHHFAQKVQSRADQQQKGPPAQRSKEAWLEERRGGGHAESCALDHDTCLEVELKRLVEELSLEGGAQHWKALRSFDGVRRVLTKDCCIDTVVEVGCRVVCRCGKVCGVWCVVWWLKKGARKNGLWCG